MKFTIERNQLARMVKHTAGDDDRLRLWACAARVFVEANGVIAGTETLVLENGTCIVPWTTFHNLVRAYNGQRNVTVEANATGLRFENTTLGHLGYTPTAVPPAAFEVFPVTDTWVAQNAAEIYGSVTTPETPSKPQSVPPKPTPPAVPPPASAPVSPPKPSYAETLATMKRPELVALAFEKFGKSAASWAMFQTNDGLRDALISGKPPVVAGSPVTVPVSKPPPVPAEFKTEKIETVNQSQPIPVVGKAPELPDIQFTCPYCGQSLEVEARGVGIEVNCPKCGQRLTIPMTGALPEERKAGAGRKWRRLVTAGAVLRLIAAMLLLWAVATHPYWYYQLLRWAVCGVAAYSAVEAFGRKRQGWCWTMVGIAVVFNPIWTVHMKREEWAVVDVIAAAVLVGVIWQLRGKQNEGAVEVKNSSLEDAEKIIDAYAAIMEKGGHVRDVDTLPYPRETIRQALDFKVRWLTERKERAAKSGRLADVAEMAKYLESLRVARVFLCHFVTIEPDDREAVAAINACRDLKALPQEKLLDALELVGKYFEKGIQQEGAR